MWRNLNYLHFSICFKSLLWDRDSDSLFSMCVYVCGVCRHVHMCVDKHIYVRACMHFYVHVDVAAKGWSWVSSSVVLCIIWGRVFHLDPELSGSASVSSHLAAGIPCLGLLNIVSLSLCQPSTYVCAGDLNSDLHTYTARILLMEPPSSLQKFFIWFIPFKYCSTFVIACGAQFYLNFRWGN